MRRVLSEIERKKALEIISPIPLKVNPQVNLEAFSEVVNFSKADLGRSMLNHPKYCLVESLMDIDPEGKEKTKMQSKVKPTGIDNILLTSSLKAYCSSLKQPHEGDIAFLIPPFSYSYPLFLSYHLILQHLGEKLLEKLGARFKEGTGILIISDNVEILSKIWRTAIGGTYLREFINTYVIEANQFKRFTFNEHQNLKHKKLNQLDGSLPWLGVFRAVRLSLPENLEKNLK